MANELWLVVFIAPRDNAFLFYFVADAAAVALKAARSDFTFLCCGLLRIAIV